MSDTSKMFADFKAIINEKQLDVKLDEPTFEAYLNYNKDIQTKTINFISAFDKIKSSYSEFAQKGSITIPDKKNNKAKNKKKKKKEDYSNRESDFTDYSSASPTLSHSDFPDSKNLHDSLRHEVDYLKSKIDNIKLKFSFSSMENVAKNIHLFDEYFMRIKAEQQKNEQLNMINMFKSKASIQSDNVSSFFNAFSTNDNTNFNKKNQKPDCFQYYEELNKRWQELEEQNNNETQ